jgi:hypothetical protein
MSSEPSIKEVPISEIPGKPSKYLTIYRDICLRLERTPATHALKIHCGTEKAAKALGQALAGMARKEHGNKWLAVRIRPNGTGVDVYVSRGKGYKK